MQQLSPIGWALRPLKRYAEFSGRSSRAEFWWYWLFLMIAYVVLWIGLFAAIRIGAAAATTANQSPLAIFGAFGILSVILLLFWLVLFVPSLAVQVRRLHDTNRSGWWIGALWLFYLVYMIVSFGSLFSTRMASDGSMPNMTALAAMSIIALVVFVYSIVLLVFWCLPGTKGANRFGEDPYGPDVHQVFA